LEKKSKAETFIGFLMRSKKYRIGMNAVQTLKKANLIIVCHSASENTKQEAKKTALKLHAKVLYTVSKTLEEMTHKENAKVMAVLDKDLANAIINQTEKEYITGE